MVNILPSPLVSIDQTTIKPGIYDISNEAYHQGHGISRSALMEFKRSPYHYWYKYLNPYYVPESATPAQIFGNALHTFILEPKEFEKQFFTLDKFDKRTKAGAEYWRQIQAEQGNKTFLKEAQYQELQQMADSLQKNKLALQLIENAQIEQSLYWTDPDTGILCKCRPDILQRNFVCDLKSAQDGSAWAFSKAVLDYGYHIQAAMIREALLHTTRQGEDGVRSRGARDRRALTGKAGNASRRQVIEEAIARSPEWASAWRTQDESGLNISRVMRTNFGGTTVKIFREHSDSLEFRDNFYLIPGSKDYFWIYSSKKGLLMESVN